VPIPIGWDFHQNAGRRLITTLASSPSPNSSTLCPRYRTILALTDHQCCRSHVVITAFLLASEAVCSSAPPSPHRHIGPLGPHVSGILALYSPMPRGAPQVAPGAMRMTGHAALTAEALPHPAGEDAVLAGLTRGRLRFADHGADTPPTRDAPQWQQCVAHPTPLSPGQRRLWWSSTCRANGGGRRGSRAMSRKWWSRTCAWRRDGIPSSGHLHCHARPRDRMAASALQERRSTVGRLDGPRLEVMDYAAGREVTAVQEHYQRSFGEDTRYYCHG
jgi:hypothetical protein